jgi:hypothetical protein
VLLPLKLPPASVFLFFQQIVFQLVQTMSETDNLIVAATIECAGQTSGQRRLLRGKIESVESLEKAVRSAYGFGLGACLCFSVQTNKICNV